MPSMALARLVDLANSHGNRHAKSRYEKIGHRNLSILVAGKEKTCQHQGWLLDRLGKCAIPSLASFFVVFSPSPGMSFPIRPSTSLPPMSFSSSPMLPCPYLRVSFGSSSSPRRGLARFLRVLEDDVTGAIVEFQVSLASPWTP